MKPAYYTLFWVFIIFQPDIILFLNPYKLFKTKKTAYLAPCVQPPAETLVLASLQKPDVSLHLPHNQTHKVSGGLTGGVATDLRDMPVPSVMSQRVSVQSRMFFPNKVQEAKAAKGGLFWGSSMTGWRRR